MWENNFTKAHVPRARTGEWTGTAGNNYGYDQLETPYGYRRERIRFAHATPLRLPDEGPAEGLVICGAAQKKSVILSYLEALRTQRCELWNF